MTARKFVPPVLWVATALISSPVQGQHQWTFPIGLTDGIHTDTLRIGVHPLGTDGYDPGLDDLAPPPPPSGAWDVRLRVPSPPDDYLVDIRGDTPGSVTWYVHYQPAQSAGPVTISWDPDLLPAGYACRVTDNITGALFDADMRTIGSVSSDNMAIATSLRIVFTMVTGVSEQDMRPDEAYLGQNFPNPFNPGTSIRFSIAAPSHVSLDIFDQTGRRIARVLSRHLQAGVYPVHWDGHDDNGYPVGSGVYLYRLETAGTSGRNHVMARKMIVLR